MKRLQWDDVSREIITDAFGVAADAIGPLKLYDISARDISKRRRQLREAAKLYFKAVFLSSVVQCAKSMQGFVDIRLSRNAGLPDFDLPIRTIEDIEIGAPIYAPELVKRAVGGRMSELDRMGHKLRGFIKDQGKHEISFSRHAIANINAALVSYILWLTMQLKLNEPRGTKIIRLRKPAYRDKIRAAQETLREYANEWLVGTGSDK